MLTASEVRRLARELGLVPAKDRGQNFVIDPNTVRRIVALAELPAGARVLEVGPGLGSLTLALAEAGHPVVAVEIDQVLSRALPATVQRHCPQAQVQVLLGDAVTVASERLGEPAALVANLPYNTAVPILLHLLCTVASLSQGLVMVQREVAERLCSPPGSRVYGVPSVKAAWWARLRLVGTVPRTVFWPAPRVDSMLVAFTRRPEPDADRALTFAAVDAAFAQRRKTLRAALAPWAGSPAAAEALLRRAGVEPALRGENLGVEDFARLARVRG